MFNFVQILVLLIYISAGTGTSELFRNIGALAITSKKLLALSCEKNGSSILLYDLSEQSYPMSQSRILSRYKMKERSKDLVISQTINCICRCFGLSFYDLDFVTMVVFNGVLMVRWIRRYFV
jgi:hypothetical protein